ncbi:MAG: AAA family ATPase [Pirellulaceae bacterium]
MITKIAVENFKGIRERVELDLKPLTLLFGPNSAGKSTVLHALHYAREILDRRNLSPDRTVVGGKLVDLGGFENFVHGHDTSRPIRLQIGIRMTERDLPEYPTKEDYNPYDDLTDLFSGITDGWVAVTVAWSDLLNRPFVAEYEVGYNSRAFARITLQPGRPAAELTNVDLTHPILTQRKDVARFTEYDAWEPTDEDDGTYSGLLYLLNKVRRSPAVPACDDAYLGESIADQPDALPRWGRRLGLPEFREDTSPYWENSPLDASDREELWSDNQEINAIIGRLVVGPGELICAQLRDLRYLGPLREIPERLHAPPQRPDPARWASGLGCWDLLETGDDKFLDEVSRWLGDEDRLDAGYHLVKRRYKELDVSDPLVVKLLTGRAFDEVDEDARLTLERMPTRTRIAIVPTEGGVDLKPHDVGVGLSQLVPVIVTALDGKNRVLLIDQSELLLHPKLQAELGDLFIEATLGDRQHTLILETHSELIPLRLMRRIRETKEGQTPSHLPPIRSDDVSIYYVETHEGATVVTRLELSDQGQLLDPWPNGFFEEGYRERFSQ